MFEWVGLIVVGLVVAGIARSVRPKGKTGTEERKPLASEPHPALAPLAKHFGLRVRRQDAVGEVRGVKLRVALAESRLRLSAPLAQRLTALRRVVVRSPDDTSFVALRVGPGFDRALRVELEPEAPLSTARAELTGWLADALLRAAVEGHEPELDASTIQMSVPQAAAPHEQRSAVLQLVALAKMAGAREPEVRPPAERRVIAVWRLFGPVQDDPISLTLERPTGTFVLELDSRAGATHVTLHWATPVATELHVVSAEQRPALEDLELGDTSFDRAFVISGDIEEARRQLRPSVRDALLALVRDGAAVEVRSDELRIAVPALLDSESAVEAWLAALDRVAVAFAERGDKSAYR